ncbi:hypothetical protein LTR84_009793 [Exophiala bonariae]|uniref:RING-type domain-containing protein n=1 Tax=Exophiala bonariae TaxID=1690606 RepID=A0AAV9NMY3_9EURO|nr:hypothetical protein LTR84_009793 [Exophiala bonariae]
MAPRPAQNRQQDLPGFTSLQGSIVDISDDDEFDIDPPTFAPALHHYNTFHGFHSNPIDLTSDPIDLTTESDGEWLATIGRTRPSQVPQPMKRIRLDSTLYHPTVDHNTVTAALPPVYNPFEPVRPPGSSISRATLREDLSIPNAADHRPHVTHGNLGTINATLPLLPGSRDKALRKKLKSKSICPYFYDSELEVTMYRGTGYERFPVARGTIDGHQAICDKWDAAQERKRQKKASKLLELPDFNHRRTHGNGSESPSESDDSSDEEEVGPTRLDQQCLVAVLEVFPDAQHQFLLDLIMKNPERASIVGKGRSLSVPDETLVRSIINEVLELDSYPKQSKVVKKEASAEDGTGKTITWNKDLPKDSMYLKDGVILLAKVFDHIPTWHIHKIVNEKQSIFDTYVKLHEQEEKYYQKEKNEKNPYPRLRMPRVVIEKKYQYTPREQRYQQNYAQRINELQAVKQHVAREAIKADIRKEKEAAEDLNLQEHKAIGAIVQCGCCFEETIALNRVVPCDADAAHSFCFACVSGLAESQVGLMKYEMKCMDGSACSANLSWSAVAKAVDIKTFDRLEFNKQQAEIIAAGLEGLEKCPFCDFQAICDDIEIDPLFACQNPECGLVSCRKCRLENHLPKTCEQHKKDNDLGALHRVEEARSDAVMRTCPKCKVKIMKEDGCNKMICSTCRTFMCYECQEDLSKLGTHVYDHFNKPGSKCSLYDRVGVDRHEAEADDAEREAIRKAKEEDATIDESRLRVETGKTKPTPLQMHPAHDLFAQHEALARNWHPARHHAANPAQMIAEMQQMAVRQMAEADRQRAAAARRIVEANRNEHGDRLRNLLLETARNSVARPPRHDAAAPPATGNRATPAPGADNANGGIFGYPAWYTAEVAANYPANVNHAPAQHAMPPLHPAPHGLPPGPQHAGAVPKDDRRRATRRPRVPAALTAANMAAYGMNQINGPEHVRANQHPWHPPLGLEGGDQVFDLPHNWHLADDFGFQDLFGRPPAV